jgi:hypothetical protein
MPRHELVLRDAVQEDVHDRPLRRDLGPAAIGLRFRQRDGGGAAEVNLEAPFSTKTRLQTTSPGLQTPFSVPPPRRKYMGGWRSLTAPL